MRRILVAVDGSEPSLNAARMAWDIGSRMGARVTLIHARIPLVYPPEMGWVPGPEMEKAQEAYTQEVLRRAVNHLGSAANVDTVSVLGSPAEAIAELARTENADLVVIGSRGRGAVARVLLGSVADRLVHICERPVLIVR